MKKILFMIVACLSTGIAGAQTRDAALETKIIAAVKPVTQKLKYVLQTGFNVENSEPGVYFTDQSACIDGICCDGSSYCTHLVISYEKQKNCRRRLDSLGGLGFIDVSRQGGRKNRYNMVHKNVCYEISTQKKKDAEALARALKNGI